MTAPPNRPGDLPGQAAPTLADALAAGAFTVPEAVRVAIEIAQAVEALHEQGMVHRGIDPRAIFLTDQGVIVAAPDGVEVVPDATQQVGLDQDRAAHSPPEAFLDEGPLTPASDVYALGSLLFRMLAGQPAFRRRGNESSLQYILRLQRDPIPPFRRTDVPQDLRDVIERAMAKEPAHRYPDAHAFADALYPFAPPETTRAPVPDTLHADVLAAFRPEVQPAPSPQARGSSAEANQVTCTNCGASLPASRRFCSMCGAPIAPAATTQATVADEQALDDLVTADDGSSTTTRKPVRDGLAPAHPPARRRRPPRVRTPVRWHPRRTRVLTLVIGGVVVAIGASFAMTAMTGKGDQEARRPNKESNRVDVSAQLGQLRPPPTHASAPFGGGLSVLTMRPISPPGVEGSVEVYVAFGLAEPPPYPEESSRPVDRFLPLITRRLLDPAGLVAR